VLPELVLRRFSYRTILGSCPERLEFQLGIRVPFPLARLHEKVVGFDFLALGQKPGVSTQHFYKGHGFLLQRHPSA
jgi:hypothetical protein